MSSWQNRNNIKPRPKPHPVIQVPHISQINVQMFDVILPPSSIFEIDSYEDTNHRINNFKNQMTNAVITFIIPSINRNTLLLTIKSLLSQNIDNWKAIVIFDGCQPADNELLKILNNNRILYFTINKTGLIKDKTHGAAGYVRNIGMNLVTTPWIGFVDDDDTLTPNYTEKLIEEIKYTPNADAISFRMIDNNDIYLPDHLNDIVVNHIGISFCYKTHLFRQGIKFEQCENEDFRLLNLLKINNKKIVISPFITYLVRNSLPINTILNRITIN